MENYSVMEVIEQAVQTEKLGREFYLHMAKKFENDEGLNTLFTKLAQMEEHHEKVFTKLKNDSGYQLPEDWGEASKYLRAIVESEFFLGKNKSLPSLEHIESSDQALEYAIGFEKETMLYYQNIRDVVEDTEIIDRVIKEERSHIVWLNEHRKSLRAS